MKEVNWGRQALLALSLFVLGTFAFWLEYKHKPAQETAEEEKKRVFSLQDTSVKSLTITQGNLKYTAECLDFDARLCKPQGTSRWSLLSPIKTRADDSNFNSLVTAMGRLDTSDTIDLKDEPAEKRQSLLREYGLDAESRKTNSQIEVTTAMGTTVLSLGLAHPVGSSVFALRIDNGKENESLSVYMIPNYFSSQINHDLSYWRDKKVVPFESHEIVSFEMSGQKDRLSGARKEGLWELKNASGVMAGDSEMIDQTLNTLTHLSAKAIVSEDKKGEDAVRILKGSAPLLKITLTRDTQTAPKASPDSAQTSEPTPPLDNSIELSFFEKKTADKKGKVGNTSSSPTYLISSASSVLYELDANSISRFEKEGRDLRQSRLLTPMEQFTIKGVEVSHPSLGSSPIAMRNVDGKWTSPAHPDLPQDKIQGLLEQLGKSKIQGFLTSGKIPAGEKDGLELTLENDRGEIKKKWLIWKKNGQTLARDLASKRAEAMILDPAVEQTLPWTKDFFSQPALDKK